MPRRTLRSIRGRQPYVEAFPALDTLVLERERAAGRPCCQWTNERGVIVGHIEIETLTHDQVTIRTHFLGAVNVGYKTSIDRFRLVRRVHNENHTRSSIACPGCGRLARFIYNVAGHWACRYCHDLTIVSQLLGKVTRYLRRLQELDILIARGRQRYERRAKFAAWQEERSRLLVEFADAPPLPPELAFAQYAEWLARDDDRLKPDVAEGDAGYGWTRLDAGGFLRLTWQAEQERARHDEVEFSTRGRASASAVKALWTAGPNVTHTPFATDAAAEAATPKPFRYDPNTVLDDGIMDEDPWSCQH